MTNSLCDKVRGRTIQPVRKGIVGEATEMLPGSSSADAVMPVGPLNTLKQIRRIIKRTNDHDLTKLILDLQKEYFALKSEHLRLNAEFVKLEREMDLRRKMHMCPPSYYYFQDGDDIPYCPVCWESAKKAVHLRTQSHADGGIRRECLVCKQMFWEKDNGKRANAASRY